MLDLNALIHDLIAYAEAKSIGPQPTHLILKYHGPKVCINDSHVMHMHGE